MEGGQIGVWPKQPPNKRQLMELIRRLVDSRPTIGTTAATDDFLVINDLDMSDVLRGFREGSIVGAVTPGVSENEWCCTIAAPLSRFPKRKREIWIGTVVVEAASLTVRRVQWAGKT